MGDFNGRVYVALRKESVDRNTRPPNRQQQRPVALRKESVDRNLVIHIRVCAGHNVALRKESVDRNVYGALAITNLKKSLSSRRAWNVSLSDCSGWFCSCGYPL